MISSVRGIVQHRGGDHVVVDVHGVGMAVAVPAALSSSARAGEEIVLHTSLIVREDALSLFGFETREELELFGLLVGVSGVGPKSALGVLSHLTVSQIAQAVNDDDDAPFRRVSGIGPKTAKLIVVQLAGKIAPPAPGVPSSPGGPVPSVVGQVAQALIGLGWPERVATEAATEAASHGDPSDGVPVLLRQALAALGPAARETARG